MSTMKPGIELTVNQQREVLAAYVHRYTMDHKPQWANKPLSDGRPYKPQFASDADWLAHTEFVVNKDGTLSKRNRHCVSHPTWPQGQ